jgi:hypothetical protein
MWETAENVARTALDALSEGRVVAIPGAANRLVTAAGRLIPNRLLVPRIAKSHPGLRG